jgi:amphi-Trp domain-containing protein
MDILEIESKETMSREEAAARLRAFADTLARNNDIEFDRGGMHMKVHVPDEIHVKVGSRSRAMSVSSRMVTNARRSPEERAIAAL